MSVLHYHHVDIREGNYSFTSQTGENDSGPFDKLIDATHECTIQQFASTVLNYNFVTVFDQIENPCEQKLKLKEIIFHPSKPHYHNTRLRAPPSNL